MKPHAAGLTAALAILAFVAASCEPKRVPPPPPRQVAIPIPEPEPRHHQSPAPAVDHAVDPVLDQKLDQLDHAAHELADVLNRRNRK